MPYSGNRLHPTQKPVAVLESLIDCFSRAGQIVLDPFAGSGSTLIAVRNLGRAYIGIELDPSHHRAATKRLQDETPERSASLRQKRQIGASPRARL